MQHKELTHLIIGCAMKVYNTLGSGFPSAAGAAGNNLSASLSDRTENTGIEISTGISSQCKTFQGKCNREVDEAVQFKTSAVTWLDIETSVQWKCIP